MANSKDGLRTFMAAGLQTNSVSATQKQTDQRKALTKSWRTVQSSNLYIAYGA